MAVDEAEGATANDNSDGREGVERGTDATTKREKGTLMDESDRRRWRLLFKSRTRPRTETSFPMVSRRDQKIGDQRWFSLSNVAAKLTRPPTNCLTHRTDLATTPGQ